MMIITQLQRCRWANRSPELLKYHDQEWGVPQFDEQKLFASLSLEIFQAGLQWELILKKRQALYRAFNNFNYQKVAKYSKDKLKNLLNDPSIIRNRAKILAIINNARIMQKLHHIGITLKDLTWRPLNNVPLNHLLINNKTTLDYSDFINPFLIQFRYRGFKRVGPETLYSYLQAVGAVNDHIITCFRHRQICLLAGDSL